MMRTKIHRSVLCVLAACFPVAVTQGVQAAASDFSWVGAVQALTEPGNPGVIDLNFPIKGIVLTENPGGSDVLSYQQSISMPTLHLLHQPTTPVASQASPFDWPLAQTAYPGGFKIYDPSNPGQVWVTADVDLAGAHLLVNGSTAHLNDALTVSLRNVVVDPSAPLVSSPVLQMFNLNAAASHLAMVLTFQYTTAGLNNGAGGFYTYSATVQNAAPTHSLSIPEPTTAAITGVAGLLLLRRRRA